MSVGKSVDDCGLNREGFVCGAKDLLVSRTVASGGGINSLSGGTGDSEVFYDRLVDCQVFRRRCRYNSGSPLSIRDTTLAYLRDSEGIRNNLGNGEAIAHVCDFGIRSGIS